MLIRFQFLRNALSVLLAKLLVLYLAVEKCYSDLFALVLFVFSFVKLKGFQSYYFAPCVSHDNVFVNSPTQSLKPLKILCVWSEFYLMITRLLNSLNAFLPSCSLALVEFPATDNRLLSHVMLALNSCFQDWMKTYCILHDLWCDKGWNPFF